MISKELIIESICGGERMSMCRAELLLSASVNFIERKAWAEAEVCNDEGIKILEQILFKIKENRKFLKYNLSN